MATEAADFDSTQSYKDPKEPVSCLTDSPRHRRRRVHALLSSKRASFHFLLPEPPQRLLTFEEAPKWMQQNSCIRSGYRPELGSFRACVRSLTFPHNELLNCWTHLIPSVSCLVVLLLGAIYLFELSPLPSHALIPPTTPALDPSSWRAAITPVYPFPGPHQPTITLIDTAVFAGLVAGAGVCFALSAAYHCGLAHSERVCSRARRADHLGILFAGSMRFLCSFHYGFYCDVKLRNLYSFLMFVACCIGVYVIVLSDRLQAYEYRKLRTGVFIGIGSLALVPFSHGVLRYGATSLRMSFGWLAVELLCVGLGSICYSERLPEALFPDSGLFDLVGHSHMWFHLLAVAAVLAQYGGATEGFRAVHGIDGRAAAVCIKSG
ncbi:hypothetical protein C6P46_002071 [Rhodotorula mucilaginosa]|uniref:Uncharacterized protein n=1 Tax=Rhodotorula mucilaginosa TaxID=5537 RepID=A0A9P7B795_RHOMI|nr:hypothetical protein C6P46_002071 [Rhodotorula mucilaginosa]